MKYEDISSVFARKIGTYKTQGNEDLKEAFSKLEDVVIKAKLYDNAKIAWKNGDIDKITKILKEG